MINKNNFLQFAKEKFPEFDYSKVVYTKSSEPIIVICPKHGEFITKPGIFIRSTHGCPKCANESSAKQRSITPENFIKKCKEVWGDKYTYEKTIYINSNIKIVVTCPIHGDFKTRPSDFIRGHGCPKCKGNKTSVLNKKLHGDTLEDFINKAKLLYDNLFEYSKVIYKNSRIKVCIHSNLLNEDFLITPAKLLCGQIPKKYLGLPKYASNSLNTEIFIQRAKLLYENKYDYSKVEYKNIDEKVCIICPEHGEFWQTPINHLWNREGCPVCAQSKGELAVGMILKTLKYEYCSQYPLVINNHNYRIDFCVIINNSPVFIEYNGKQHYEPITIFGGEAAFKLQQERDNIIREYCKENKIQLLEYSYIIPLIDLKTTIEKDLENVKNKSRY